MSHTWVGILAAVVGLGVMVFVHEWGHFVAARICGVRVDVFSLGYGSRIFGWRRGPTDYRISVFPLGGYVKMAGDNPAEERSGSPDEFLAKPRWQRLFVIVAGPFMNFVLAFALLWGLFMVGMPVAKYIHQPAVVAGVPPNSPVALAGIQAGDKIVAIDGTRVADWGDALDAPSILPGKEIRLQFERASKILSTNIKIPKDPTDGFSVLGYPKERIIVDVVDRGLPAAKAGIKSGDEIISVNGTPAVDFAALQSLIQNSAGKLVHLVVRRNSTDIPIMMTPVYTDPGDGGGKRWVVGYTQVTQTVRESYSFFSAASQSWDQNITMTHKILSLVVSLVSGKTSIKSLAGPVGIVQMSTEAAKLGFAEYIIFMAFLSIDLGILNLLPIPILDGGHVLMLAIEGSLRRDLSITVKERFVTVGLVFLLAVFGFVMYYDVVRLLPGH